MNPEFEEAGIHKLFLIVVFLKYVTNQRANLLVTNAATGFCGLVFHSTLKQENQSLSRDVYSSLFRILMEKFLKNKLLFKREVSN